MFMSADVISAHRAGISEEITRTRCAAGHSSTWIEAGIDCWRASLKGPLRCWLANTMISQAIHQRILVINTMWLWGRIGRQAAQRVVPKVVVTNPGKECQTRTIRVLDSRDDQIIPEGHGLCSKLGRPAWAPVYSHSCRHIQRVVVHLKSIDAAPIPGAYINFSTSFFGSAIHQSGLSAIGGTNIVAEDRVNCGCSLRSKDGNAVG